MNLDDSFNCNPFLTTVIGDFNAESKKQSEGDRSTIKGSKIAFLVSQFGLSQIIKEPLTSSCIDLIFKTQANMVLESGVHHSLHQNCCHQIIFAKLNLKVYYPSPVDKDMFTIFNKQLIFLIGRTLSLMLMLMIKWPFFPTLS